MRRKSILFLILLLLGYHVGKSHAANILEAILQDCGDRGEIKRCEQWLAKVEQPSLYCNLGYLHYRDGLYHDARTLYQRCQEQAELTVEEREEVKAGLARASARVDCIEGEELLKLGPSEEGKRRLRSCLQNALDLSPAYRKSLEGLIDKWIPPKPCCEASKVPLHKKWWFWAGIGTVVVGGVAMGVVLGHQEDPLKNVPPENQRDVNFSTQGIFLKGGF